ncbi:MAG: TonB-dependent receptor [Bacteroidota bacterium]
MKTRLSMLFLLAVLSIYPQAAGLAEYGGKGTGTPNSGATLSGFIRDAATEETLVGATVQLKGTRIGAVTNKSGFYSVSGIAAGKYTAVFSYLGYSTKEIELSIGGNESKRLDAGLSTDVLQLEEVTVEGNRMEDTRQISVSRINIPLRQISQLRVAGEADVFRSLQFLPGVLASSQISSGLYIRGGSPDQTLVLLDGSTVYNPSHMFGFYSTFNPDAIKDVELIKGGFPAEYGGRMSAVLDLVQMDGNRNDFEGKASLGLISSRLSVEGPVGNGSWFLSGRRTYIDLLTSLIETEDSPLPSYYFYDLNGKITQDLGPDDKLSFSGFHSKDQMDFVNKKGMSLGLAVQNSAAAMRWTHLFSDQVFSAFNLSWSKYGNGLENQRGGFGGLIDNSITDMTLKGKVEWFASSALTVLAGVEGSRYDLQYLQQFGGSGDSATTVGETDATNIDTKDYVLAGYGQVNYHFTAALSAQLGLRTNYYQLRDIMTLDPRAALRLQLQPSIALKAAWGMYHQYFRLASVPDFSFFDTWLPTDGTVDPSLAVHYVLGLETHPFDGYEFNVETYYKDLYNVSELREFATQSTAVNEIFYNGTGQSYGIEFFLQKRVGNLTGWAGYALGYITSTFDELNKGAAFRPKWDRRHDLKLVAQYRLNDRWEVGASFTYQSGQSYTGQTSRFQTSFPGDNQGIGVTVPADLYGLRLPASHQLNLNANYHTTLFGQPAKLLIDIYNIYSHRDIWYRYYDTSEDVTEVTDVLLLPIIPSAALEITF